MTTPDEVVRRLREVAEQAPLAVAALVEQGWSEDEARWFLRAAFTEKKWKCCPACGSQFPLVHLCSLNLRSATVHGMMSPTTREETNP